QTGVQIVGGAVRESPAATLARVAAGVDEERPASKLKSLARRTRLRFGDAHAVGPDGQIRRRLSWKSSQCVSPFRRCCCLQESPAPTFPGLSPTTPATWQS